MGPVASRAERSGDPAKLVGLLWAPPAGGGRSGLSVERVTRAAVALADREGLDAVTMRRVAEELGVGAMTLYTYVPGRPELVELMVDAVAAQVYAGGRLPGEVAGWRPALEHVVARNWDFHRAHPWTVDVPPGRPVPGPGVTGKYEAELAPLDGIGLGDVEMDQLLAALLGLVAHCARWQVTLDRVVADTSSTDLEWWATVGPELGRAIPEGRYPLAGRVGSAVGEATRSAGDPAGTLRAGVDRLLDGVEQLLAGRR